MVVTVLCGGPCGPHARVRRNCRRQLGADATAVGSVSLSSLHPLSPLSTQGGAGYPSPIWCIPWCGGQRLVLSATSSQGSPRKAVAPDEGVGCLAFHGIRCPDSPAWSDR